MSAPAPSRPDVHGRVVTSGAIVLGASILGAVANFALVAVVGRGTGAGQTGLFLAATGIFLVIAGSLRLGADTGLVRFFARLVAQGREHDLRPMALVAVLPVLATALLVSVVAFALADPLGALLSDPADAAAGADVIRRLAPFLAFFALTTVLVAGARGLGRVGAFAAVQNVLLPAGRLAGVVVAVGAGGSLLALVTGWIVVTPLLCALGLAILVGAVRRVAPDGSWRASEPGRGRALAREFWTFALPRGGAAMVETALDWIDVVLVALLAGPVEAGIYGVATRVVKVVQMVDYATRVAVSTRISAALVEGDTARVQRIYALGTQAMIAAAWPFLLTLAGFGATCMALFGDGFAEGGGVLVILAVGMMGVVAAGSVQSILLLGGLSLAQLRNKSVALALLVSGNLLVTPAYGATGAAVVWCVALGVDALLAVVQVRRRMGVRLTSAPLRSAGVAAIVAILGPAVVAAAVFGASPHVMIVSTLCGLALYALVLARSGALATMRGLVERV